MNISSSLKTFLRLRSWTSSCRFASNASSSNKDTELLHIDEQFRRIPKENRNKATFNAAIQLFQHNRMRTRGLVEFLNTALKYLKEYNLHKDLDTYKALLNVFPKGPLIPTNVFQKVSLHYPLQQHCCVKILDEMEWNGVQPDKEVHDIVANIFGEWNFATRKIKRMLYWMPKLKYTNKYLDRRQVENQNLTATLLARIALKMMCRDPGTLFTLVRTRDGSVDISTGSEVSSWLMSAQSPLQRHLISQLPEKTTINVDGPKLVYVMDKRVQYFVMSCPPWDIDFNEFVEQNDLYEASSFAQRLLNENDTLISRNLHQQPDETILAMAVFENPTEQMALQWINHLTESNKNLLKSNILFRIKRDEIELPNDKKEETCE
uniref:Evolutionarily conserved signaling intermediate in Toll pathway, mitochondrial n=1 Tax=Panagrolaimus sp. JU765 TaxID=591449 RepID=A0AC34PV66_9BILA